VNKEEFDKMREKIRRLLGAAGINYAFVLVGEYDGAMGGVSVSHLAGDCCENGLVALSTNTRALLRLALDTAPEEERERLAHLFRVTEIPSRLSKDAVSIIWQDLT